MFLHPRLRCIHIYDKDRLSVRVHVFLAVYIAPYYYLCGRSFRYWSAAAVAIEDVWLQVTVSAPSRMTSLHLLQPVNDLRRRMLLHGLLQVPSVHRHHHCHRVAVVCLLGGLGCHKNGSSSHPSLLLPSHCIATADLVHLLPFHDLRHHISPPLLLKRAEGRQLEMRGCCC